MKKQLIIIALAAVTAASATASFASEREIFPRFEARQESNFEQNSREFKSNFERQQADQVHESIRDKSHDFPRVSAGKDSSVGLSSDGVNYRRSF